VNYLWNLDGGISSDVTSQNVVVNFNIPGNHIISLIVSDGQCQSSEINHNIYIEATPNIQLDDFNPDIICIDNGLISVPSATPTGGLYYDNFGALVDGTTLDPTLMTIDQPNYVYYLYTSQSGCNALDSSVITVTDCSGFNNGINNSNYVFQDASDGEFYLHLISEVQDVVLYNSMGQIIRNYPINSNNIRLDLSKEPVGIYFLSTNELNQNKIYKLFNK
jgi:PKD repeat protein